MTLPGYAVIHRDLLSLTPLMIDGSSYYKVDDEGIADTQVAWDIDETSSPFVEGSQVTNDIRGMVDQQMKIQVRATDQSDLQTAIGALIAAVSQRTFQVDLVIGSITWSWSCRRKTYALSFNRQMVFSTIAVVTIEFDRYPTPVTGPY
jgi:hypothetical protein